MLPRRLRHLRGERKMNEAVADIVGAAPEYASPLGLAPGRSGTDFVDPAHLPGVLLFALSLLGISRKCPEPAPTVSAHPAHFKGRIQALLLDPLASPRTMSKTSLARSSAVCAEPTRSV